MLLEVRPSLIDGTTIDDLKPAGPGADNTADNQVFARVTANNGFVFRRDPDGSTWSPASTTTDVTFAFRQGGSTIATHVVRVTRTLDTIAGATLSESGDATVETISGNGSGIVTIDVVHSDTGASASATVTVILSGEDGADGADGAPGAPGAPGADGEGAWTANTVGVVRSGTSFAKNTGVSQWGDAAVWSSEGFSSCHVSFRAGQTNRAIMIGLSSDPTADHSYTSLDYTWYLQSSGVLQIYEGGSPVSTHGTYSTDEDLTITYDGYHVRYWRNQTLVRTVSAAGLILYLDSAFYATGGGVTNLVFAKGDVGKIDLQTKVDGILSTAFMAAGAINSNISLNANGTLNNAGGGQVSLPSLPGSIATGQLTTNLMVAMQTVTAQLSAIAAELGSAVISTTGHLRSGQTAFDTGTGFFIGHNGSTPVLSIGNASGDKLTWDGSIFEVIGRVKFSDVRTFTPTWTAGFGASPPTGNLSYIDLGTHAMIWNGAGSAMVGTSTSSLMTMGNLPPAITPASNRTAPCALVSDGDLISGLALVNNFGGISFLAPSTSGTRVILDTFGFPASGPKGLSGGFLLFYPL